MAVNDAADVDGSVSGGCVEGAVVSEALEVLASSPRRAPTVRGEAVVARRHGPVGSLGDRVLDQVVTRGSLAALESGFSATLHHGPPAKQGGRT